MLINYFRISFRHLSGNKLYLGINVFGLSVAIALVLLALLYLKEERSYDGFHEKKEDLYRILTSITDQNGKRETVAGTGQPQGPAFKQAVPDILEYTRVMGGDIRGDVIGNEKTLNLQMLYADENFFNLFTFPLVYGDRNSALSEISAVVITESVARKFFNTTDVVGKFLNLDADPSAEKLGRPSIITAVAKDLPGNSSIRFDILMPMRFLQLSFADTAWFNQYLGTFVMLQPAADPLKVSTKFDQVFAVHARYQLDENKRLFNHDPQISYGLQNITEMHLNPLPTGDGGREGGIVNESKPIFSLLFLGIAFFILFMASINFINISIAGSLKRAKEVGIRKVSGENKGQIKLQFLLESSIICILAFLFALVLIHIGLPLFNELIRKELKLQDSLDIQLLGWFTGIVVFIILLSGIYPAYILSSFKPTEVLYNKLKPTGRNIFGRSLVVIQFSLAVFFIISTIIYYQQMNFIRTKELGYDPYQVIRTNIRGDRDYNQVRNVLRNELGREPAIKYVSFGADGQPYNVTIGNKKIEALHEIIDEYRIPALQIKLKAGRNISSAIGSDKHNAVLVNEAFVKVAGLESPIGTQIYTDAHFDNEVKTIVGIIEDYHTNSLHTSIKPMVMFVCDWISGGIWIRMENESSNKALKAIENAYKKAMPTALFEFNYLDELNALAYEQEKRWQKIISVAAIISIIICCLGLFGLAHLATQRRTKEIGIRKVLGATVSGILSMITFDFLQLVFISILLASPLAWWIMNRWLQDFAYRITITGWIFILAGMLVLVIAFLTVSLQAVKAATVNPAFSLKNE